MADTARWRGESNVEMDFFLNNQRAALIIQIYSVIKLYIFAASSQPIIRSSLLYISVIDGPHIRRCAVNLWYYNIIIVTIVLKLPKVFNRVTCRTGL